AGGPILPVHPTSPPAPGGLVAYAPAPQPAAGSAAPVSGGGPAAAEGRLLVMVGGASEAVERSRPVFETYADQIVHLGEVGSGQATKLLNNLLFTANLATAASTLALGQELGISPDRLGEVISHGTANSFALGRIVSAGGTLDRLAAHAGDLLRKDVGLVAGLAEAAGIAPGIVLGAADATLALMDRQR
ncbi:NAD-binding protein, partial [Nocardia abscessus]|uniref:NAD-binding protein n=1 Tax=Nocardia abscessus TaxID=120957 RepID=UPI002458F9CA